ncbi:hypothetical protein [Thermotalea metallivorans]|uniref:Uncharacterized protein n=1 Tax=Thermotalea metallivorans TaxID=520762 RepID=A0A140LA09_9FIRM|nr:hypothetical protein [Thermotalea metallivorans]KXG77384.1 hypothetical protein AN619_05100 [Thermotalea metallivorans]
MLLNNHNPNQSDGQYIVEITFQEWNFSGRIECTIKSEKRGIHVLTDAVIAVFNGNAKIINSTCDLRHDYESRLLSLILKNESNQELQVECGSAIGLGEIVVGFRLKEKNNTLI